MRVTVYLKRWAVRCVLSAIVLTGAFVGSAPNTTASASAMQAVAIVNAASFASDGIVAPKTIVAAFGPFKTLNNQIYPALSVPLPKTLGGVKASFGATDAELLIVTPGQINLVVPPNVAPGPATVVFTNSDGTTVSGTVTVVQSQPGIFTATSTGSGVAAAQTTFDGVAYAFVSNANGTAIPINAGTAQQPNFLILYLTGLGTVQTNQVKVTFLGVPGRVDYAGPHPSFSGLDQINVRIPWELAGLGTVKVEVTVTIGNDVRKSNPVTLNFGGEVPPILAFPITPGQTVDGALTYEDQIQTEGDNVYFFDAYVFDTTAANVSVAFDLRSPRNPGEQEFDALLTLYRLDGNQLTFMAQNDQTGGIGDGEIEVNNNALLLTVLAQPGRYVLIATTFDFPALQVGTYRLSFRSNVIQQLTYGQSINAEITTDSVKTSGGVYINTYWFQATQGDKIEVIMRSTVFDSLLLLYRNYTDPEIAFDDNSFGPSPNRDAKLTFTITETGKHLILATPFELDRIGAFTLSLNKVASAAPDDALAGNKAMSVLPSRIVRNDVNLKRFYPSYPDKGVTRFDRVAQRRFKVQ